MEAPWCVGSIFPAYQLLNAPLASPLIFEQCGHPQCVLTTGCLIKYSVDDLLNPHDEEDLSAEEALDGFVQKYVSVKDALASRYTIGNRLEGIQNKEGLVQLFFPVGANADSIGSCVFFQKENGLISRERGKYCDSGENTPPYSISPSVRQPIFQIAAQLEEASGYTMKASLAARTINQIEWITSESKDDCISFSFKGVANFEHLASHIAWSPHGVGEAAVILENGDLHIFDLSSGPYNQSSRFFGGKQWWDGQLPVPSYDIQVSSKKTKRRKADSDLLTRKWWNCEYSWHPQVLLVAGYREIVSLDLRQKLGGMQPRGPYARNTLASINIVGGLVSYCKQVQRKDHFTALARATGYDDMYQFAAATTHHLQLFDVRHPNVPLLQWEHGMRDEPPGFLRMHCFPELPSKSQATVNAFHAGKFIVACACKSGDVHAFGYGPCPEVNGNQTEDMGTSDLYAWGLPSKLTTQKAHTGERLERSFNVSGMPWERKYHVPLPELENAAGLFTISPSLGKPVFTMLELTGSGQLFSQSFTTTRKSKAMPHEQLQAIPKAVDDIGRFNRRANTRYYFTQDSLPAFLNYIQDGLAWPSYTSPNSGVKHCDTATVFHENHFKNTADKLKDACLLLIKKMGHPFSIYEISSKAMWQILPHDIAQQAVEVIKGILLTHTRSIAGLDLPEIQPGDNLSSLVVDASDLCIEQIKDTKSTLLGPAVPLPVLLELQQLSIGNPKECNLEDTLEIDEGSNFKDSLATAHRHLLPGSYVLSKCRSITSEIVNKFKSESLVPQQSELVISLCDDSVGGLWSEDASQNEEKDGGESFLFHNVLSTWDVRTTTTQSVCHDRVVERDGNCCTDSWPFVDGNAGSFEMPELQTYVGSSNGKNRDDKTGEVCLKKMDADVCPISLPFKDTGKFELLSDELDALAALKELLKQWQMDFEPYVSYCTSHVYRERYSNKDTHA